MMEHIYRLSTGIIIVFVGAAAAGALKLLDGPDCFSKFFDRGLIVAAIYCIGAWVRSGEKT